LEGNLLFFKAKIGRTFVAASEISMNEEHLDKLRARLNEIHRWPSVYMFKFILPSDEDRIARLKLIFGESAEFKMKLSAQGNYTSVTVREMMLDADSIFDRYLKAGTIEGIISL
jgi:putative lipoic acid-binding regulatory protein